MLPVLGVGAAYVELHARIEGEVTEQWWCPAIEVEWPDETKTMRESDCTPFADASAADKRRQSWQFGHWMPEGENKITVTLLRNGEVITRQTIWVTVGSTDGAGYPTRY